MALPPGVKRFAVTINGTETEEEVASLTGSEAVMAMLEVWHMSVKSNRPCHVP